MLEIYIYEDRPHAQYYLYETLQNDFTLGKFVPLTTTCILCNQKFVLNVARLVATNW